MSIPSIEGLRGLSVAGTQLFWALGSSVTRTDFVTGESVTIDSSLQSPTVVGAGGGFVFWRNERDSSSGDLYRAPVSGGAPELIYSFSNTFERFFILDSEIIHDDEARYTVRNFEMELVVPLFDFADIAPRATQGMRVHEHAGATFISTSSGIIRVER